ncbi:MAG: DUF493 domain-containing protein [Legionellaceae bacterium]|nr:DUF493 domain-containing protein [Legionellaceae bacterium]
MTENKSLMQFPCDFPLKIIGKNSDQFLNEICEIIRNYFPIDAETAIQHNMSQQGNYMAITATVRAHDQATLDAMYQELTKHPDIKMVL